MPISNVIHFPPGDVTLIARLWLKLGCGLGRVTTSHGKSVGFILYLIGFETVKD